MVYKCKSCGAKLNVDKNDELVTCEYCDSVNKVEFSKFDFYRNMSAGSKKYTKIIVVAVIAMIIFGIGSLLIFNMKTTDTVSSFENTDNKAEKFLYYHDGGYLIDNNEDDFLDIVTIGIKIGGNEEYLQILDGKTGEKIKSVLIDMEKEPKLFVVNQTFICVPKKDFTISIYNKKDLSEIKTYSLSDKLNRFNFSENKLFFETHDKNSWTIDFSTLELKKENFDIELKYRPSRSKYKSIINEGDITYSAKIKDRSSKDVFSVTAEKEGDTLWNLPLGFEDITWLGGPVIVSADQNIITFGKKFTSDNLNYLIGIDKTEGRIKYEVQKGGKNCKLYDFYYNGRYIIANIEGFYQAYDPSTGETKWSAGRKCNRESVNN